MSSKSQPDLEKQHGNGIEHGDLHDGERLEKNHHQEEKEERDFDLEKGEVDEDDGHRGIHIKKSINNNNNDDDRMNDPNSTSNLNNSQKTSTSLTTTSKSARSSPSPSRPKELINDDVGDAIDDEVTREEEMVPHRVISKEPDGTLLVGWEGDDDPESPANFSLLKRWTILLVICAGSVCVTCASSMVGSTYEGMERRFNISREVATLGLSLFVAGLGVGPLFLGPLSERYGRNPIYRISFVIFTLLTIPVALAPNIEVFLIFRFLTGGTGSAFLSVSGGTTTDLFRKREIGVPMSVYSVSPFLGPVMGPIVAGFINQNTNWRWTWYVCLIWSGVQTILLFVLVPETYAPALLKSKAQRLRKSTGNPNYKSPVEFKDENNKKEGKTKSVTETVLEQIYRPFELLILEPMALLLCLYTAILLGQIYMFFSAFPIVFARHGFNLQMTGLSFLGVGLGFIIGTIISPFYQNSLIRLEEKLGHPPPPEEHLKKAMLGGILCPISLFWFAFTSYQSIHWSVPIIGTIFFGIGANLIFQSVFTFLVDAYRPFAATSMAANAFLRSCFAAGFPLFTVQMYNTLHPEWASALCGFLCLIMSPLGFIFYRIGPRLRKESKFSEEGLRSR